jgi:protein involved in polysaccharide export with SLBB domain
MKNPALIRVLLTSIGLLLAAMSVSHAQVPKVGPGDAVKVTVRGVPDTESTMVNGVYKVDANGLLVGLPYLEGSLQAAGLTEGQLSQNITAAYKMADIYTKASFTAIVDSPPMARQITVGGRAIRQGPQNYFENMTIYDAFTAAGGADKFGQRKRVFLLRPGEPKQEYNMDNDEHKTVRLLPNDTIVVDPKKAWEL